MSDDSEVQNAAAVLSPNIKAQTPPWMANTSKFTMPQGMPNQLNMLSANLAAGGFGTQPANMKHLDQVYDPVEVTKFGVPPQTPKKPTKPAPDKAKVDAFNNDPNRMVLIDGQWKPAWQTGLVKTTGYPTGRNSR